MYNEMCGDNRFEIIAEAKRQLLEYTTIETSPDNLCGCGKAEASNQRLWLLDASPRYYEIYVDNLTGVQYLRTYKGGVCVMVDAEGKPLIWNEE